MVSAPGLISDLHRNSVSESRPVTEEVEYRLRENLFLVGSNFFQQKHSIGTALFLIIWTIAVTFIRGSIVFLYIHTYPTR